MWRILSRRASSDSPASRWTTSPRPLSASRMGMYTDTCSTSAALRCHAYWLSEARMNITGTQPASSASKRLLRVSESPGGARQ